LQICMYTSSRSASELRSARNAAAREGPRDCAHTARALRTNARNLLHVTRGALARLAVAHVRCVGAAQPSSRDGARAGGSHVMLRHSCVALATSSFWTRFSMGSDSDGDCAVRMAVSATPARTARQRVGHTNVVEGDHFLGRVPLQQALLVHVQVGCSPPSTRGPSERPGASAPATRCVCTRTLSELDHGVFVLERLGLAQLIDSGRRREPTEGPGPTTLGNTTRARTRPWTAAAPTG
jgi:hypothetical protein